MILSAERARRLDDVSIGKPMLNIACGVEHALQTKSHEVRDEGARKFWFAHYAR